MKAECAGIVVAVLCLTSIGLADGPRTLIERGNALYEAGQYAEALEVYNQVADPPSDVITPEWLSNRAAAHFKLGQYEQARDLWVRAAGLRDAAFEAACRYNLGNVNYRQALDLAGASAASGPPPVSQPAAADAAQRQGVPLDKLIGLLDGAIGHYRDALALDATLVDARANIELAEQLKKQIKDQATSQPQSQQSQPSPEQDDKSQQDQNQQNQNSSQPSSQPEDNRESSQSRPASQPQSQPSEDQQQPDESEPQSQPAPQSQPSSQPQPQPEDQAESQPADEEQPQPAMPINLTQEQAERLLQKVRDAEKARRQQLKAREAGKHKPVEKDW